MRAPAVGTACVPGADRADGDGHVPARKILSESFVVSGGWLVYGMALLVVDLWALARYGTGRRSLAGTLGMLLLLQGVVICLCVLVGLVGIDSREAALRVHAAALPI